MLSTCIRLQKLVLLRPAVCSQYIIIHHSNCWVDHSNRPMLNLNLVIISLHVTFHLLAIAMFAMSDTICKIWTAELYMTLTLTFRTGQGQMPMERSYTMLYLNGVKMSKMTNVQCRFWHLPSNGIIAKVALGDRDLLFEGQRFKSRPSHSGKLPYKCGDCEYWFKSKPSQSSERPYKCDECN